MQAAPIELLQIGLDPARFVRARQNEWHGPCPVCGGSDRFRIHTEHMFPRWNYECRQCGRKGWADQLNAALRQPISEAERQKWAEDKRRKDQAQARQREQRLAEFTSAELWAELHRRMAAEQRQQWEAWGIPTEWQNYLELGYTPHYSPAIDTPAYTIPYFHNTTDGRTFATIQYRLMDAPNPEDRYRFEYGLPTTFYETTPTEPIKDIAIICEGAKKAMNVKIRAGVNKDTSVLAVPSKNSWGGAVEAVKDCKRVYVMLDPDGLSQAQKLGKEIGGAARIVELPSKIDDMLLGNQITKEELKYAFRWAVKA
jgi:hypothetical protein